MRYIIKAKYILYVFILLLCCISNASCAGKYDETEEHALIEALYAGNFLQIQNHNSTALKKLQNTGAGSVYYAGLYLKDSNIWENSKTAKRYFEYASKHSPFPYNIFADEEVYELSSNEEKLKIIESLLKTENLSSEKKENAIYKRRKLLLLLNRFHEEKDISLSEYYSSIKLDTETVEVFETLKVQNKNPALNDFFNLTEIRVLAFKKEYQKAWQLFKPFIENGIYPKERIILSDMGKTAVYGSENYAEDAELFEKTLIELEALIDKNNTEKEMNGEMLLTEKYMFAFYAARLYLKSAKPAATDKAATLFKKASQYAPSSEDFDNALWYVLETLKTKSFTLFFQEFCASVHLWKNAYIYEDFAAYICMKLTAAEDWNNLKKLYDAIIKTNLIDAQARIAYILARSNTLAEKEEKKLLTDAFAKDHSFFYYKAMAAYRLGLPITASIYVKKIPRKEDVYGISSDQAMQVLKGLAKYKLYSRIYQTIVRIYPQIKTDEAAEFASLLYKNNLYADSMKTMSFAIKSEGSQFSEEHLQFVYPRPYLEAVRKYAAEYHLPEYLLFALIRSESYFKASVVSHAGAVGLAQLMKSTAADIARRLKVEIYDLHDPSVNIRFGAFYLAEMIRKNAGNIMTALFSYNAGPNAVKRWIKQSGSLPADLFLESLAYTETRGYGRNVLAACIMYGVLYYGKNYTELIEEIFGKL